MTARAVPEATEGRSLKLYELGAEYLQLKALIDQLGEHPEEAEANDGGPAAALGEALAMLGGAIEDKADGIGHLWLQQSAEADALEREAEIFEAEAKRLRDRATVRRNANERLRQYLAIELAKLGPETQKLQLRRFTVTLAKQGKDRAVVTDATAVPASFKRAVLRIPMNLVPAEVREFVVSTDVAKRELQDYVDHDGVVPPGVELQPGTRALRIY